MGFPPGFILFQVLMMALPVGAIGFFGYLALRFVRAKERETALRGAARHGGTDAGELAKIQETLATLQAEVHELRENQEFIERLLEKPRGTSG
jgi:hypothetical protein